MRVIRPYEERILATMCAAELIPLTVGWVTGRASGPSQIPCHLSQTFSLQEDTEGN